MVSQTNLFDKPVQIKKTRGQEYLGNVTSDQIKAALAVHHRDCVVIPECKTGPSWSANFRKLDVWCMTKSYTQFNTLGYEIKVSRSDFEQDQKWIEYLPYCHQFFFACPAGLIRATDLPKEVGLVWYSNTGNIHIKTRGEPHNPDPEKFKNLLVYVLMSRSRIVSDMYQVNRNEPSSREDEIKSYVDDAERRGSLALMVNGHIKQRWQDLEQRESELISKQGSVEQFQERLKLLGITWDSANNRWEENHRILNQISNLRKSVDPEVLQTLRRTAKQMLQAADEVEKYYQEAPIEN